MNLFDRFILRGRSPQEPVPWLYFARLVWAIAAVVLLATMGAGVISWAGQQKSRQVCIQRNAASVQYREALGGLAEAAEERGDKRSAAIFRALRPRTDLPDC